MTSGKVEDVLVYDYHFVFTRPGMSAFLPLDELVDVQLEDLERPLQVQRLVAEGGVGTRLDGLVEDAGSIGGEEDDAFEVFEDMEKDFSRGIVSYHFRVKEMLVETYV